MSNDDIFNQRYGSGEREETAPNSDARIDSDGSKSQDVPSKVRPRPKSSRASHLEIDVAGPRTVDQDHGRRRSSCKCCSKLKDEEGVGVTLAVKHEYTRKATGGGEIIHARK